MVTDRSKISEKSKPICLYDTTLRDGSQRKGLSFSLEDKLKITRLLDEFGVHYVEGGWPGSNPKDLEYFKRMRKNPPKNARIVAFGSTCRVGTNPQDDANLQALLDAGTPVVALVGKTSMLHVTKVLQTNAQENLRIIAESISYMKQQGKEVVFDAEHFFDAFNDNSEYAIAVLTAAEGAGADWLVLCDTNGGTVPSRVAEVVSEVRRRMVSTTPIGVHAHNDCELAVANSLAAVGSGATMIQGTVNGYGERCGNANLISIVPTLQLKLGYNCVLQRNLRRLTELSRTVSEIANLSPDPFQAYVGASAFAHKGGLHVAAVEKIASSYEHIPPETVGNSRQVVVSELSGRGNIRMLASELGVSVNGNETNVLKEIKDLESQGYQFENAEGTVELMLRRGQPGYLPPFKLIDTFVQATDRSRTGMSAEAVVKVLVNGEVSHTASSGRGPVHALDLALRKALLPAYPSLAEVRLADYKVRILDPDSATDATTRVVIEATCGDERWSTVGCSQNIIDASYQALADSLELYLLRQAELESSTKTEVVA
jgi:2-isopropylmalate synthase